MMDKDCKNIARKEGEGSQFGSALEAFAWIGHQHSVISMY